MGMTQTSTSPLLPSIPFPSPLPAYPPKSNYGVWERCKLSQQALAEPPVAARGFMAPGVKDHIRRPLGSSVNDTEVGVL